MLKRAIAVTGALVACGAVLGALCGVIGLLPIPLLHWLRPNPDDAFIVVSELVPWAAGAGAAIGATLGPTLALSLLRHVALWRVLVAPLIGTLVGVVIGWFVARNPWIPGIPAIIGSATVGMIAGGLVVRARHKARATTIEAAT